jgi:trans-2,3-dihydro-3-hydroxyanthranilate isomerase
VSATGPHTYCLVDVFTERPLEGNGLAVLPDARGLDTATLQRVAREFNQSETVFLFPPERPGTAAKVRIFTPTLELRFAGHPTIGASFVMRERGLVPRETERFVLDEPIGNVAVRVEAGEPERFWLTTPPIEFGAYFEHEACARALGLAPEDLLGAEPQLVSAGNPNIYVAVRDRDAVDRAWLDLGGLRELHGGRASTDAVFVFAPTTVGAYSRMFAPEHGVIEDPATGSATGPLAAYMMRHGLAPSAGGTRFTSEQGVKMGRPSFLHVLVHGESGRDGIEVGGSCVLVAEGEIRPL